MWGAVFADVGVSVIAILNAIRALNVKAFVKPAQITSTQNTAKAPSRQAAA